MTCSAVQQYIIVDQVSSREFGNDGVDATVVSGNTPKHKRHLLSKLWYGNAESATESMLKINHLESDGWKISPEIILKQRFDSRRPYLTVHGKSINTIHSKTTGDRIQVVLLIMNIRTGGDIFSPLRRLTIGCQNGRTAVTTKEPWGIHYF
jgi:hypothetical protein